MDQSPAVDTPRRGDPITAEWAAQVAAAANAVPHTPENPGAFSSPFGSVPRPAQHNMLGARNEPMPFDVCIYKDSGADKVFCFIPPVLKSAWGSLVFINQDPCPASDSQTVGTENNPWVNVGTVSHGDLGVLVLAFEDTNDPDDYPFKWRLHYYDNWYGNDLYPNWSSLHAPLVVIAQVPRELSSGAACMTRPGVRQFHRGFVLVGGSGWALNGEASNAYGKSIGNSSKTKVIDLDLRALSGGEWNLGNTVSVGGSTNLGTVNVSINGTSYKLVGRQM